MVTIWGLVSLFIYQLSDIQATINVHMKDQEDRNSVQQHKILLMCRAAASAMQTVKKKRKKS